MTEPTTAEIGYDFGDYWGVGYFATRCPGCGRFLKMPASATPVFKGTGFDHLEEPATCARCGPVQPSFLGFL